MHTEAKRHIAKERCVFLICRMNNRYFIYIKKSLLCFLCVGRQKEASNFFFQKLFDIQFLSECCSNNIFVSLRIFLCYDYFDFFFWLSGSIFSSRYEFNRTNMHLLIQNTLWDIQIRMVTGFGGGGSRWLARFLKHQTFVMNNIYDLDAQIIQIHGLFMIILSNI